MARMKFSIGTRYAHDGQVFIVRQLLTDNRLLVDNISYGGQMAVQTADLYKAWAEHRLQFEVTSRRIGKKVDLAIATAYTIDDFGSLDASVRDEAWRRYKLIKPLLKLPPKQRTRTHLKKYAAEVQRKMADLADLDNSGKSASPDDGYDLVKPTRSDVGRAVSWGSIERWLSDFILSGYDIRVLIPETKQQGGKGVSKMRPEVATILDRILQECAQKPKDRTLEDVEDEMRGAIRDENKFRDVSDQLAMPVRSTIYRHIQQLGATSILRRRANRMEAQADRSVLPGPKSTRVLERVEIDHTLLDLFIVDENDRLPIGRPTLTFAMDHYSGMPYGIYIGFEPPGYLTVMECLLQGILPKPDVQQLYGTKNPWPVFGLPEVLVIDNGREFIGQDLDDACAQLGIVLERTAVRSPWLKGGIERAFRTMNTKLIHKLPGTTFSNITERGDYNSEKHACISLSALLEIVHIFLMDQYAQSWHTGKHGVPAKLWHESVQSGFVPALHTSADETRILLGRIAERTIQRTGIDFQSIRYQSPDLMPLRTALGSDTKVRIKYDPNDLGYIYVFNSLADTEQFNTKAWLKIPALDQDYASGLSIWKHSVLKRYLNGTKQLVNPDTLLEAKRHWQQIVRNEFLQTRKLRRRKISARFLGRDGKATASGTSLPADDTEMYPPNMITRPLALPTGDVKGPTPTPTPTPTGIDDTDDLDSDEDGWGGSYDLPHHKRS